MKTQTTICLTRLLVLMMTVVLLVGCTKAPETPATAGLNTVPTDVAGWEKPEEDTVAPTQEQTGEPQIGEDGSDLSAGGDVGSVYGDSSEENVDAVTTGLVNVRNPALVPWGDEKSLVQQAVDNKTMLIVFMSGEGLYINSDSPTKWGDSIFLIFPNGQTMLIDAGMPDYGAYLVKNLKKMGVEKLDYCMMSHQHEDHYMGFTAAEGIFNSFEVGTFLYSGIYHGGMSSTARLRVEKMATFKGAKLKTLAQGDTMTFGDVTMTVIMPERGRVGTANHKAAEDVNADSLVVRFDYGETSFLTAGDLYMDREREILRSIDTGLLRVDIAKMDHHGRSTSSCDEWCAAVGARVAMATGSIDVEAVTYASYAKVGTVPYVDTFDGFVLVEMHDDDTFTVETSRVRENEQFDALDKHYNIERKTLYGKD